MSRYPSTATRIVIHLETRRGGESERTVDTPPGWSSWTDPMRREWARDRCAEEVDRLVTVTWSDPDEDVGRWDAPTSWYMDGDPVS